MSKAAPGGVATELTQLPRMTRDLRFRRETAFVPTRTALDAFAGTYGGGELDVQYEITHVDSALVIRHRKIGDSRLDPALRDAFTLPFKRCNR